MCDQGNKDIKGMGAGISRSGNRPLKAGTTGGYTLRPGGLFTGRTLGEARAR